MAPSTTCAQCCRYRAAGVLHCQCTTLQVYSVARVQAANSCAGVHLLLVYSAVSAMLSQGSDAREQCRRAVGVQHRRCTARVEVPQMCSFAGPRQRVATAVASDTCCLWDCPVARILFTADAADCFCDSPAIEWLSQVVALVEEQGWWPMILAEGYFACIAKSGEERRLGAVHSGPTHTYQHAHAHAHRHACTPDLCLRWVPPYPPGGGGWVGLWPVGGWVTLVLGNLAQSAYSPPGGE